MREHNNQTEQQQATRMGCVCTDMHLIALRVYLCVCVSYTYGSLVECIHAIESISREAAFRIQKREIPGQVPKLIDFFHFKSH